MHPWGDYDATSNHCLPNPLVFYSTIAFTFKSIQRDHQVAIDSHLARTFHFRMVGYHYNESSFVVDCPSSYEIMDGFITDFIILLMMAYNSYWLFTLVI